MPQVSLLLYGAALAAPPVLFGILIWSGLERWLETAGQERLVRSRIMRTAAAPAAAMSLVMPAPAPALARRSRASTAA